MTKLEIIKSQEYHDLLRKLNPLMNFDLEYDDSQQMIDYFKYQSNVEDKVSYMERHMVTYEFINDYKYQNYLKSDMLYDTYNYLKDTGIVGVNKKQLRMRVRGIAENDGIVAFHVQDDMTLSENIFDKRFFTHILNLKGFMDLDIQYVYHEDGVIEITDYKATKPSLFNLVGFFSNFKARLKLYSYFITFFRLALRLFAIMFLIDNNIKKPKK